MLLVLQSVSLRSTRILTSHFRRGLRFLFASNLTLAVKIINAFLIIEERHHGYGKEAGGRGLPRVLGLHDAADGLWRLPVCSARVPLHAEGEGAPCRGREPDGIGLRCPTSTCTICVNVFFFLHVFTLPQ